MSVFASQARRYSSTMSKFLRMMDVLDLFSGQDTLLTAEDMVRRLRVSRPTAFRYARELTAAGFLANYSGSYSLGARIITLDYRIRESDPLLQLARPVMRELATEMTATVVLCRIYNHEIINVHQEEAQLGSMPIISRGRPLPLFSGSASKTMLAHLPQAKVRRLYEAHAHQPEVQAIGTSWADFWAAMKKIRQRGYYVSIREVSEFSVGIAAPIALPKVGTVAVLSLVLPAERLPVLNVDGLGARVVQIAQDMAQKLSDLTHLHEEEESAV